MAMFIIRFWDKEDGDAFVAETKERMENPILSYSSLTTSFFKSRIKASGKNYVFEFTPNIPEVHYFFFIIALFLWIIGLSAWAYCIPIILGLVVWVWFNPLPYILIMMLGYKKKFGHFPNIDIVGRKRHIKELLGWK